MSVNTAKEGMRKNVELVSNITQKNIPGKKCSSGINIFPKMIR